MWTAGDMSLTVYLNIVAGGLLTGLVYGLAGLGLSLIHAVTRTVNLAHGVLMALALALAGTAQLAARHGGESGFALPAVAAALFLGGFLLHRLVIGRAKTSAIVTSARSGCQASIPAPSAFEPWTLTSSPYPITP